MNITSTRDTLNGAESGRLGIPYLKGFWAGQMASSRGLRTGAPASDWARDNTLLAGLRLGLRETYDFILRLRPSFEAFESWVLDLNGGEIEDSRIEALNRALSAEGIAGTPADPNAEPSLTAEDLAFWEEHGYVVLHDAVSPGNCEAAADAIREFLGAKPGDPETWYGAQGHTIWIPLLHHPALQANRDSPRVKRAFAQLWNREDIWMNVDQAGFNPPERPGWPFPGPHQHWDVSLAQPIPFGVQGILYLADTAADQGAFTCVPGFHRKIESWLSELPADADPREQPVPDPAVPIAGRAGDLVIWHHALPHGSSPNRSNLPRIVQYMIGRPSWWEHNPIWR